MRLRRKTATLMLAALLAASVTACGGDDTTSDSSASTESSAIDSMSDDGTTAENTTADDEASAEGLTPAASGEQRTLAGPAAAITIDGDPSDWADVPVLEMTMGPIVEVEGEGVEPRDATLQVAHDDENLYVLFTVDDDFNWDADDAHKSAAAAVMFPITAGAGEAMGADDDRGERSTGTVDMWHWELGCPAGTETGGAVSDAGDGDPGNDATCNFDDEWAVDAENREDDLAEGAENSLLGVWNHSEATEDADGTYVFEISRPLQTGDADDAQFVVGEPVMVALAYWDPDFGPDGWDDDTHVQSSSQGWILVTLE